MNPLLLLFLLLPIAFLSGWWSARRLGARRSGARVNELSSSYFRGLNYLLNEQPDKAIEVFLQLAEANRDTVETHLALGNLFRRRGEVERAIRVHQHLIARANLSDDVKTMALLELGEDYMRAGLLDRAETLFADLVAMNAQAPSALRHLIAICQHERDWHKAILYARRLEETSGERQSLQIAHFYCELAERAQTHGAMQDAADYLQQAFVAHPKFVRALILRGRFAAAAADYAAAIAAYEQALESDIDCVPEILPALLDTYARAQQMERAEQILGHIVQRYEGVSPVLALARIYARRDGQDRAVEFLGTQLRQRPSVRGLVQLMDTTIEGGSDTESSLRLLRDLTAAVLEGQALYRCTQCGFGARAHHWQCPSCKNWSTLRPVHGATGA
ncbi:tetratricopeptide repeat protein [mine drainage metagenome]|uniref:Tetratricopeptide repeat protein n=2 Tax=mine drainage metagenome TaxID=410659 RepID=T1AJE2_9ZZZZ